MHGKATRTTREIYGRAIMLIVFRNYSRVIRPRAGVTLWPQLVKIKGTSHVHTLSTS